MPVNIAQVTVPISGTVSDAFGLTNADRLSIWCPALTSCALRLLGSHDTTSANFVPVHDATSAAARTTFSVGAGSKMLHLGDVAFAYVKLDLSAAQAAARTFTIISR
jgi:hypothetical protein